MKRWIVLILIAVMFAALLWFAFACRQTSQSASTAAATATYGAEMFHYQLTALAP